MKFKTERKLNYIGVAIVFVIAFVLICVGVLLNSMHNIRVNNWLEVEGYIINIDHEEEKVFVSYLVDGKIYANQLDMYSSNLKENESISLLVSDKGKVYAYEFKVIYIILYISSAVTFITGLIIYFALRYKDKVIALCLRDGVKRKAIVDKITKSYQKNGTISSYRIIAYYKEKKYKSINFYLPKDFKEIENATVDLYLLDNGKYYIDIDSYKENIIEVI